MLTNPLEIPPVTNMAATAHLPVPSYPGKQSYYPPLSSIPFLHMPHPITNVHSYYREEGGGVGSGSMSLSHLPIIPPANTYDANSPPLAPYNQGADDLVSPDNLISPEHSHEPNFEITSSPPQELDKSSGHQIHIDSSHEGSMSPNPNTSSSPPPVIPSADSIAHLPLIPPLPPQPVVPTSILHNLPAPSVPLQHHKDMYNITPMVNSGLVGSGKNFIPHGGATQHHFPQTTQQIPAISPSVYPSITQNSHPTTNFVMYPPQAHSHMDYHRPIVRSMPYHTRLQAPKLSYDTPRFKLTPERATPLQKWFDEHRDHPYPTRHDKILLCQETNLTFTQVSTWFANCRRRMKKASQEDEEKQHCNGGTSNNSTNSLHNGTTTNNGSYSCRDDATPPPRQRPGSQSPQTNSGSPDISGHHDTEEKIHNYGALPPKDFSITYSRNSQDMSPLHYQQ